MAGVIATPGAPSGGSFGSVTVGRNRYGTYWRNRTKPVNPNSATQALVRQIMGAGVLYWAQTLTTLQRSQWENWAATTPWTNRAGEAVHLTGQSAFIRSYLAYANNSASFNPAGFVATPPAFNDVGALTVTGSTAELDVGTGELEIALAAALNPLNTWNVAGGNLLVEITPGQNANRNFPGSRWAQIRDVDTAQAVVYAGGATTATITVPAAGSGVFAIPWGFQVGQKIWLRVRGLSASTDRRVSTKHTIGPFVITAAALLAASSAKKKKKPEPADEE